MRGQDGYRAVLAERAIRWLLLASLLGRVGFLMLPLSLIFLAGSAGTAGALIAAFSVASALAPVRGRIVDRFGTRALTSFALASAIAAWTLVLAESTAISIVLAGLVGLVAPPVGPFARATYGAALRAREPLLQRTYALDSAGEEATVIIAPLLVALLASTASARAGLAVAAAAMLAGTALAARTRLVAAARVVRTAAARTGLPAALWLLYGALAATAAALGAIDIAVPAAARRDGSLSAAGVLLAAMAVATVAGSLLAGRLRWRVPAGWRIVGLTATFAGGVALTATATTELILLGAALLVPGVLLGALLATAYVLADRLAPEGSGTRGFAWLVTANNGGLALGAAVAGGLVESSGPAAGLWLGAACALAAVLPAAAAAVLSARVPSRAPIGTPL